MRSAAGAPRSASPSSARTRRRCGVDAAVGSVLNAARPWSTGSTLINFQGFATAPHEARRAWSADTLDRLTRVTSTWDPDRRFRFGYSILD